MWDDVVEEDAPAQAETKPAEGEAPAEGAPAPEGAPAEGQPEEAQPPPPENAADSANKKLICKHWVRPAFSQYNYIYEYRKSYYDDIIAYLDKRNHGIAVDKPAPQTWGERALRTYVSKGCSYSSKKTSKDTSLLALISVGARFHRAHTKSLISRKYSKLGFTSISI